MQSNSPPSNDTLTEICAQISLQIDMAKQAKEIWDHIGEPEIADAINKAKFGVFFGVTQRATLNEVLLGICRVFDDNPRVISIKAAINSFVTAKQVRAYALREQLISFNADPAKVANLSNEKLVEFASKHMHQELPKRNTNAHLDGIIKIRNEYIAHDAGAKTQFLINEKDIEFCLGWADRFIALTHNCFGTHGEPSRVWSPKMSLRRLLHKSDILKST